MFVRNFDFQQSYSDGILKVRLTGAITENANFPAEETRPLKELWLEMKDVTYSNSIGIQRWVLWLRNLHRAAPDLTIRLGITPVLVAKNITMVREFIPNVLKVESVYVPYFCENCDLAGSEVLIQRAWALANIKDLPRQLEANAMPCVKCGAKTIVDIFPDKYFWFWKQELKKHSGLASTSRRRSP